MSYYQIEDKKTESITSIADLKALLFQETQRMRQEVYKHYEMSFGYDAKGHDNITYTIGQSTIFAYENVLQMLEKIK